MAGGCECRADIGRDDTEVGLGASECCFDGDEVVAVGLVGEDEADVGGAEEVAREEGIEEADGHGGGGRRCRRWWWWWRGGEEGSRRRNGGGYRYAAGVSVGGVGSCSRVRSAAVVRLRGWRGGTRWI